MKNISIAALLWAAAFASVAAQNGKSVNDGIYTEAQAARGKTVFAANCTTCHEPSRFTGPDFLSGWTGKSLHALFDHMSTTMPEDNPGGLKPQQYADVVAFFLQLNEYPAGKTELESAVEGLKAIKFDKPAKK
jgi:mono/diheme cytochrome c family protein